MIILLIKKYLRKYSFRKARNILKGFRHLKSECNLGLMKTIKYKLATTPLNIKKQQIRRLIMGTSLNQADDIIRQYLLTTSDATFHFERAFLPIVRKNGIGMICYLPPQWRTIIRQHGFKVIRMRSFIAWNLLLLRELLKGIITAYKIVWFSYTAKKNTLSGQYIYFAGLTEANLPKKNSQGISYDIVSWYSQWEGRNKKIDYYAHNIEGVDSLVINEIPIIPLNSFFSLTHFRARLFFTTWCTVAFWLTIFDWCRGRWWHALLFREAILAKVIRLNSAESLATDYIFHEYLYRPMWTYEAEKKGSNIILYFYSLSAEAFRCWPQFKNLPKDHGFEVMSWPRYLVWDNKQAEDIRKTECQENIEIVGPVWFVDSEKSLPPIPETTIAVFDNTAFRESIFSLAPVELAYYSFETVNLFINDIYQVALENKIHIAFKRKRDVGNWLHPKFQAQLNQISSHPQWIHIESDIAAVRIIKACKAVISIPFTSTGVIANHIGKSSVYYDPLGIMQKEEREAHGVQIVTGRDELAAWMHITVKDVREKRLVHEGLSLCQIGE